MISPFWSDTNVEAFTWIKAIVFGRAAQAFQSRSSNMDADFWLVSRLK